MRSRTPYLLLIALVGCTAPQPQPKSTPVYFKVEPSTAGAISGRITFSGPKPPRRKLRIDEDLACVHANRNGLFDESIVVNRDGALANVFVYVKKGLEGKQFTPPEGAVTIDQKGCRFSPRVMGVRVGQVIRVTNSDPVTHNIHPQARMNREWNQSQPEGAPPLERKFVRSEVMIRVKCNVHSWMRAYIGVLEHPYFAVTGADGSFEIRDLPPGSYTIEAWHEKLGSQEQQVTVPPSGKQEAGFTFKGV
ncbi:MAG: carboxypeptidase regulatory-like domain-containing protein [Bryobacteraceae bacterium]|nr:carboxypeptidase regulatory-like domain-containing protein [Bryobacteraceae bacterium]